MRPTDRPDPAGLAPRRAALALSTGVREAGLTLGQQLADPAGPLALLAPEDRARAQRLATALFRHRARADKMIDRHVQTAPAIAVRDILRLGVIEICVDGTAPHGVVDAAVSLTRMRQRHSKAAGLVNAVLRKVAETPQADWDALPVPRLPAPLRKPLVKRYGARAVAGMEAAHLAGAPLDMTPRDPDTAGELADAMGGQVLPTGSIRLHRPGQVTAMPGYAEGTWWVQDAAAALPVRLLGPRPGETVLDLCAAPGGKTLQLAAAGARVTAVDLSETRLRRVHENLARTGLQADVVVGDVCAWQPDALVDAVLLDAPCSATGTIRRHPELPFLRQGDRIDDLLALQARMVDAALAMLRPGGRMVYCTCSLLAAEGEAQLDAALMRHPDLSVLAPDAQALGVSADWITAKGGLRLRPDFWADQGGIDGFFMAVVQKGAQCTKGSGFGGDSAAGPT